MKNDYVVYNRTCSKMLTHSTKNYTSKYQRITYKKPTYTLFSEYYTYHVFLDFFQHKPNNEGPPVVAFCLFNPYRLTTTRPPYRAYALLRSLSATQSTYYLAQNLGEKLLYCVKLKVEVTTKKIYNFFYIL